MTAHRVLFAGLPALVLLVLLVPLEGRSSDPGAPAPPPPAIEEPARGWQGAWYLNDERGHGIEAVMDTASCMALIEDWQVPNAAGWVASATLWFVETGKVRELIWNSGHALPATVRRCLGKQLRRVHWKADAPEGARYTASVQLLLWILPPTMPPIVDLSRTEAPAALEPHQYDLNECLVLKGMGTSRFAAQVGVVFVVGEHGRVVSAASTGGRTSAGGVPPEAINCTLDTLSAARFPFHEPGSLTVGALTISGRGNQWGGIRTYRWGARLQP